MPAEHRRDLLPELVTPPSVRLGYVGRENVTQHHHSCGDRRHVVVEGAGVGDDLSSPRVRTRVVLVEERGHTTERAERETAADVLPERGDVGLRTKETQEAV